MKNIFDQMVAESGDHLSADIHPPSGRVAGEERAGGEGSANNVLAEAETARTPADVREVVQSLLKHGYLEESRKSDLFRRTAVYQREITAALEPLDLAVRIDEHRGVAFLTVAPAIEASPDDSALDGDSWAHPLVRRQRLTLEQSLLVAMLRQAFVMHEQEAGVGESDAKIAVDELLPQFLTYFDDSGSDAKNESRLLNLLDQLKGYGIVSEVDKNHEVTIRPMIVHLANPESLAALLRVLQTQADTDAATEDES